jgi:hypothetical protein
MATEEPVARGADAHAIQTSSALSGDNQVSRRFASINHDRFWLSLVKKFGAQTCLFVSWGDLRPNRPKELALQYPDPFGVPQSPYAAVEVVGGLHLLHQPAVAATRHNAAGGGDGVARGHGAAQR